MDSEPNVHLIDDDDAIRDSLAFLLESDGLSVRVHESAEAFLSSGPSLSGRCVITDIRMPGMSGLDLARRLKDLGEGAPVIVITGHGDVPLAVEAMKAGAFDFIEKPFDDHAILGAVRHALSLCADANQRAAENVQLAERLESLSVRERQVLSGLVAGHANKVIAYELGISHRTVEVYRANVMSKMHAASLSELVRMALAVGAA